MVWICVECTARYSVGAPRCPQCGATRHAPQGDLADLPEGVEFEPLPEADPTEVRESKPKGKGRS